MPAPLLNIIPCNAQALIYLIVIIIDCSHLRFFFFVKKKHDPLICANECACFFPPKCTGFFRSASAFMNLLLGTLKIVAEYYPGRLYKAFVIDPPSLFSYLWKVKIQKILVCYAFGVCTVRTYWPKYILFFPPLFLISSLILFYKKKKRQYNTV
jgi:hypothetical protein